MDLKSKVKYLFKSIFAQFGSVTTEGGLVLVYDEEGDIQVGYSVLMEVQGEDGISYEKPEDGEYHLSDGRTVVIADGAVTEIREAEAETQPEPEAETQMAEETPETQPEPEAETEPEYDAKAEVEALKQEVADLKSALEELKATVGNMLEAPAEENAFEKTEKQEKKETVEKKSIFQTRK